MKKTVYLLLGLVLITCSNAFCKDSAFSSNFTQGDTIKILCTPELTELSTRWVSEFYKVHPGVDIKVINVSGNCNYG